MEQENLIKRKKRGSMAKGITIITILLVSTLIVLSGCIGQEEEPPLTTVVTTTKPGETVPVTITMTTTPEGEERVINQINNNVIGTMDPALAVDEADLTSAINLNSPLVHPEIEQKKPTPVPHVAKSWDVSDDGLTWTFHLRDDVKFHDGTYLLAEDVVYSAERYMAIGQGFSWTWSGILDPGDVTAIDDHTVQFNLNQPYPPFLATLVLFFIVNKDLLIANQQPGDYGEFGDYGLKYMENADAGAGPYMLESWTRGEGAAFVKFDDYFRGWRSNSIDRINFLVVREEATGFLMMKTGDADLGHQWFTVENHAELDAEPHISTHLDPSLQLYHFPINTQRPPTDDKDFRYAICYAFDYDTACNVIQRGAPQARGPVPNLVPENSENAFVFTQNMTLAREHLAKSKYAPDDYVIEYHYVSGIELERKTGLLLQQNLAELGITLTIHPDPWQTIVDLAASEELTPHLTAIFDTMKFPHVDSHTYGIFHSSVPSTYRSMCHYDNPVVDDLLDAARAAPTVEEQVQKYKEVQDIVTRDAPSVFVFNTPVRMDMWDYLTGYTYVGLMGYYFAWWYFGLDIELKKLWLGGSMAFLESLQILAVFRAGLNHIPVRYLRLA